MVHVGGGKKRIDVVLVVLLRMKLMVKALIEKFRWVSFYVV